MDAKAFLDEHEIPYLYQDISESPGNLRKFLAVRDSEKIFDEIREQKRVGIPCYKLEDGTVTFDLNEVLEKIGSDVRFS